jgi:ribonucleoside-diphosphate reductase alpha chain
MVMQVMTKHGLEPIREEEINQAIQEACEGLEYVEWSEIATRCKVSWYDGISTDELSEATIMATLELLEIHPNYDFVAARLLLRKIYKEVNNTPSGTFQGYIIEATKLGRLDPRMTPMIWGDEKGLNLSHSINIERDKLFRYQGVKILYDRYLLRDDKGRLLETPQYLFMRVAMGIALGETENLTEWAIKFYEAISSFDYMPSTPTLFNAGTVRPQMASCYVTHIPDDLGGIFNGFSEMAQMSKWAGGIGTNWTSVRAAGSRIEGTNGNSSGIVPWLKIQNDVAIAVNQGGKRRGSHCAYIEPWHSDIEEFLDLRKATGDERRRTHDLDTALWIPDLFMKRVEEDGDWSLFCPSEAVFLTDSWGDDFEIQYRLYEENGIARKVVKARDLFKKMLTALFETGHPWITFKDTCNRANPLKELGMIRSSNLCTEITLNTGPDETAVCNLGSINLENHVKEHGIFSMEFDDEKLEYTTKLAVRMLDNIIDGMFYPTESAAKTNKANRPIGLGIMGWQASLYKLGLTFSDERTITLASNLQEGIQNYAIAASEQLAEEKGPYFNWVDSDQENEMRNSYVTAIAPTATISNIVGTTPSIEPMFSNLFVQSNLSGEFTNINRFLVDDLIGLDLWDNALRAELKYRDGSVQNIDRIPQSIKDKYKTAFEIDQNVLVDQAAARQPYISQSQSLNLYVSEPSGKKLYDLYMSAWKKGVKTTYYLRTLAASQVEKSTVDPSQFGKTHLRPKAEVQQCKIDDPGCESCQ